MQYLVSGNIFSMMYIEEDGHFFAKAQVLASMRNFVHFTLVSISLSSREVCDAQCQPCKAESLRRCNHICAVLLRVAGQEPKEGNAGGNYVIIKYFPTNFFLKFLAIRYRM